MTDDPQVFDGTITIVGHTPDLPVHIKSIAEHRADLHRITAIKDLAMAVLSLLVLAGIFAVVIGGIGGVL